MQLRLAKVRGSAQLDSSKPVPLPATLKDRRINKTPNMSIILFPNLDTQILKTESKAPWRKEILSVLIRSETEQQAVYT